MDYFMSELFFFIYSHFTSSVVTFSQLTYPITYLCNEFIVHLCCTISRLTSKINGNSGWMKTTSKEHGVYLPEAAGTNFIWNVPSTAIHRTGISKKNIVNKM